MVDGLQHPHVYNSVALLNVNYPESTMLEDYSYESLQVWAMKPGVAIVRSTHNGQRL